MRLALAAGFIVLLGVAGIVRLVLFARRAGPPELPELPDHRQPELDLRAMSRGRE